MTHHPAERRSSPAAPSADAILEIYRSVLALPSMELDDDFFDSGGDSLQAIQVVIAIAEIIGQDVPIVDVFLYPTPRELAAAAQPAATETAG